MKNIKTLSILFICLITTSIFAQKTVSGVTLPELKTIQGERLLLNGAGLREKLWIDLYVGGLYLATKTSDANEIINANKPMAITLNIVSGLITSEKMISAIEEGFEKSTNGNQSKYQTKIDEFISAFKEPIVNGNTFVIMYIPNKGTVVMKNDKILKTIEGLEFKKALFGIWLSDKPADKNLKNGMLGK